jgi:hypothetical protein
VTLKPGAGALPQISPHDEFLELCAISTSGQLAGEERQRLQEHLTVCPSCREAMEQYEVMVSKIIPALARDPENLGFDPSWSQEQAEAALFQRLTLNEELGTDREDVNGDTVSKNLGRAPLSASQATWRDVWTLCAAGVLLFIALGVSAYQVGIRWRMGPAAVAPSTSLQNRATLEQQVGDAGHEREVLRFEVARRDRVITNLLHKLGQHSTEMGRMKVTQNQLETELQNGQAGRQNLLQVRSDLNQRLEAAQAKTQGLLDTLDSLEHQSSQDKQSATTLEAKVTDLTRLLHDREGALDQQQELLAHDRDIRELMGARDLYIAEVYDVARDGQTKKPYGRVFYTKGKSLIFYAYDLDQQTEAKGSTFQAWGRGSDPHQALNLGVFYEDSASRKRWVLRFDDLKTLSHIDAVFVTVEPRGGSHKPSGKSLIFAYLRIDPNHP